MLLQTKRDELAYEEIIMRVTFGFPATYLHVIHSKEERRSCALGCLFLSTTSQGKKKKKEKSLPSAESFTNTHSWVCLKKKGSTCDICHLLLPTLHPHHSQPLHARGLLPIFSAQLSPRDSRADFQRKKNLKAGFFFFCPWP